MAAKRVRPFATTQAAAAPFPGRYWARTMYIGPWQEYSLARIRAEALRLLQAELRQHGQAGSVAAASGCVPRLTAPMSPL